MQAAMDEYPSSPLTSTEREIRLLQLHPGLEEDEIVCKISAVPLIEDLGYEALSYSWGSQDDLRMITVNERSFRVTAHLETALRHLRQSNAIRCLWIDALCINQADNGERLHQVGLMRAVYQNASRVIVWLGPAADDSDLAMDCIEAMANDVVGLEYEENLPTMTQSNTLVRAVKHLFGRSYWNRLWILQEVSVHSAEPLIGCGSKWLLWSIFSAGLSRLKDVNRQKGLTTARRFNRFFGLDKVRRNTQAEILRSPSKKSNFSSLLSRAQYREATEQRDHIYALFGLANKLVTIKLDELGYVPDYTKSVASVYCQAFDFAVRVEDNLSILTLRNHLRCSWLPSFVPNFAATQNEMYPSLAPQKSRDWVAGGAFSSNYRPKALDGLTALKIRGVIVDVVNTLLDLDKIEESPSDFIRLIYGTVLATADTLPSSRYPDLMDATWRTLVADTAFYPRSSPCPSHYGAMYGKLIDIDGQHSNVPNQEESITVEAKPFISAVYNAVSHSRKSSHRKFFITSGGLLGLGTPDCQQGDNLCLLYGYGAPVILRSQGNSYNYIGSAYAHGIMEGEALPADRDKGSVEFILR